MQNAGYDAALICKLLSRSYEGKPALERMGRPPLKILAALSKLNQPSATTEDTRWLTELAKIIGSGKPTVHRRLISDLKMPNAATRRVPR